MNKKRPAVRITLFVLLIAVLVAAIYFTTFFSYNCSDESCFASHLEECARTDFISDDDETTWFYHIIGDKDEICEVEVEVLQVKKGTLDKRKLEGKMMTCSLPLGDTSAPEGDLSRCHGELKEDLQNLIIQRLHNYVVENLGEIGNEFDSIE